MLASTRSAGSLNRLILFISSSFEELNLLGTRFYQSAEYPNLNPFFILQLIEG
jgi:hypothetical protein